MQASDAAFNLLKKREACRLDRYLDEAGKPTIGWGHLMLPGDNRTRISQQEADNQFHSDVAVFEKAVSKAVGTAPCRQNHFDAFVVIAFNIGASAFAGSTLLRTHLAGARTPVEHPRDRFMAMSEAKTLPANAPDQFLAWCFERGKWSKGLFNRHWEERLLYLGRLP